jgi:hypothetical protein
MRCIGPLDRVPVDPEVEVKERQRHVSRRANGG